MYRRNKWINIQLICSPKMKFELEVDLITWNKNARRDGTRKGEVGNL